MKHVAVVILLVAASSLVAVPARAGHECSADRSTFEFLVALRMTNYSSTGDSWSARAREWADEIAANRKQGKTTPGLDAAHLRFRRYCDQGNEFMAGLTLGEWIGIGLRDRTH